jgi:hypothetical protein
MALTAAERETVITFNDEDDFVHIQTAQRRIVTQVTRNKAAEILEDTTFEGTRMVTAKLPLNAITIRNIAGKRTANARKVRGATCKGTKADGKPCGRIARKDTGFCPAHS